jgi:chemotaxis methyl-accepting protein methylase
MSRAMSSEGAMNEAVAFAGSFSHVVFPDSVGGYGRAVDLAPRHPPEADAPLERPPAEPLPPDAESLVRWLFARSGLIWRHYKPETLRRRLPACLRAVGATSPGQARLLLRRRPELAGAALDALLIGVTGFFRDEQVFAALRRQILPKVVARCRASVGTRPLRVWSAGWSTGAELYSVALLLLEQGALWPGRCELLGTDCRAQAVERAAAGVFEPAEVRAVPGDLLRQYFVCDGAHYRVRADVRSAVHWRRGDVLGAPESGPWDLVLCRNLAIYLQPDATSRLWSHLGSAVRDQGFLVLGKAERPLGSAGWAAVAPCVYRRVTTDGGDRP